MRKHFDVIVAGGGTAGVVAAIQAARAGSRALLIEKNGMLGGTMTTAGVAFPGLFHAWGKQVIAGIGWDLVKRCVSECGQALPDFYNHAAKHWQQQVRLDGAIYAALCDEAILDSGVQLALHAMPVSAESVKGMWKIALATKTGLQHLTARVLVDCTGDANLAALAGARLRNPKESQPGTLMCHASGYDIAKLNMPLINRRFALALKTGQLLATDAGWNTLAPNLSWLQQHGNNANHIAVSIGHTSEGRTQLEVKARQSMLRMYRFLKKQPGLENLRIDWLAAECGLRETVTIVGESTVTLKDYFTGRVWNDAVCNSFYPIDLHLYSGTGLDCRMLPSGIVPMVPRGALVPAGKDGILVAGRCISSDRLANSALRVQATCMATGQAAGAMAAIMATTNTQAMDLPLARIAALLRRNNAILPTMSKRASNRQSATGKCGAF